LYNVADDAYVNIQFNTSQVKKYRLIGFDNPREAVTDSSKRLEGGEVGSGHSLMAIFEIEPNLSNDAANYENYATVYLQYNTVKNKQLVNRSFSIANEPKDFVTADSAYRFATAVAMFGSILRGSKYVGDIGFDNVYQIALSAAKPYNYSQKEFLELIDKADRIYNPLKKRRK
jgi:Ca-activated chloride channel family protein